MISLDTAVKLKAQNARLREALRFYASKDTWVDGNPYYIGEVDCWPIAPIKIDQGEKAKQALAATCDKAEGVEG
jgi:hypothetical protein